MGQHVSSEDGRYLLVMPATSHHFLIRHVVQYESERRKFAQDLIDFDKNWSKLFKDKPYSEDNKAGVTHEEFHKCVPSDSACSLYPTTD